MILAELVNIVDEIQLVCDDDAMKPTKITNLEKYAYCPVLQIKPGVYARKAIIRVYINNRISMTEIRRIKRHLNRGKY